ncbi:MAG: hypothetical protein IT182_12355 [Acidobacteria bacterium]|nr:hypothetical protein [Acidobacteriota bacterium]
MALLSAVAAPVAAQSLPPGVEAVAERVYTATMSSNARFVAWTRDSDLATLVVRDRQVATTSEIALSTLAPGAHVRSITAIHAISDDGRYVVATGYYSGTYLSEDITVRFDRSTATSVVLRQSGRIGWGDRMEGTRFGMSRDGRTVAWLSGPWTPDTPPDAPVRVMLWRDGQGDPIEIGTTCVRPSGAYGAMWPCVPGPVVSGDGAFVFYAAGDTTAEAIAAYAVATGEKTYYPQVKPSAWNTSYVLAATGPGDYVLTHVGDPPDVTVALLHRASGKVDTMPEQPNLRAIGLSDDGERILMLGNEYFDRRSGIVTTLPATDNIAISADGRHVLALHARPNYEGHDLRLIDLDADNDGILDGWETYFGLDPTNPADATLDADGDGVSNLDEFLGRSHPSAPAAHTRLFAEGASGTFFDTIVSLFNPGTAPIDVVTRWVGATGGTPASRAVRLDPKGRIDLASCCIGTLDATEFGVIVESTGPVVADRRMLWDRVTGYGSHASTGSPAASNTWYFAEGATISGIQTFILLQNPGPVLGSVTLNFLLSDGTQEARPVSVPARSRRTVWVNQEGGRLASAEFATVVVSSVPIVVERAVYRNAGGQTFSAGTDAIGATDLADRWFFAEGTTKGDFDTFILVANPADTAVDVTATFAGAGSDGTPVDETRTYTMAPMSRLTIWADALTSQLASADFTTTITATAPVVAERAMWWKAGRSEWTEGHVEFGATETGLRFAIADAATIPATVTDTFVLIGSPDGTPASIRLTAYPSSGTPQVAEFTTEGARTTVWMRQSFRSLVGPYAIDIESRPIGAAPATPIVVEKAIYRHNLESGAAAKATLLPVVP